MTVRELRLKKGFSQKEFANKIGITAQYLCLLENNKRNASPKLKRKIAETLECDFQSLWYPQNK